MTVQNQSYLGLSLKNGHHKEKRKRKTKTNLVTPSTFHMILNESLVSLMKLCVCNTFICQIGKYAWGKESEEFQCIAELRNVSHLKRAEIFILKAPILKITPWLTWQLITKLPNAKLTVKLKSLSLNIAQSKESMRFYHHSLRVFGNQGVVELQERKRERQEIQAFVSFIIGPTIKKFFMFFLFLYLVFANRPLLSSCGLVIWCRNCGARTKLSVKSTV